MDVLAIILACSLYPDDALVQQLVAFQSQGNPYFVGDTSTLQSKDGLTSVGEAVRVANDMRDHGGRPAVGMLGIPLYWASRYGRSAAEFFDACTNIAIGTAALAEYHDLCSNQSLRASKSRPKATHQRRCRKLESPPLRSCILFRFAADLGVTGKPAEILGAIASERAKGPPADVRESPPARAGIFGEGPGGAVPTEVWTDVTARDGVPARLPEPAPRRSDSVSPAAPVHSLE